ncbi:Transcription factor [Massospora cicadina]|nr:Transcription factor [Massospora cicadina]
MVDGIRLKKMFAATNPLFAPLLIQESAPISFNYFDEPNLFDTFLSMDRRSSLAEMNLFEDNSFKFPNPPAESSATTSPTEQPGRRKSKPETLLRNRRAAAKCRQRKKAWLTDLARSVQIAEVENAHLECQVGELKEEIINIRMILASHDCPLNFLL